jgi:uncharacterized membrane protein YfcA
MSIGEQVAILLATGLAIGFISGLLGIGGGIIMIPVQYWVYTSSGINPDIAIRMSFATSLAVILPTAISGVLRHQHHGAINWRIAAFMGVFTALGGLIGASLAAHISGSVLKMAFGAIGIIVGIRMLTVKVVDADRPVRENRWLWVGLALPIGIITGLLGIGGGVMILPILVLVLGFRMSKAVATSLGIMLFTTTGSIIGYIINGINVIGMPDYTIGYIYWPAWIALTITSTVMAQVGAHTAHKIPGRILNYLFIILVFYVGLDMLGVIDWVVRLFNR